MLARVDRVVRPLRADREKGRQAGEHTAQFGACSLRRRRHGRGRLERHQFVADDRIFHPDRVREGGRAERTLDELGEQGVPAILEFSTAPGMYSIAARAVEPVEEGGDETVAGDEHVVACSRGVGHPDRDRLRVQRGDHPREIIFEGGVGGCASIVGGTRVEEHGEGAVE